MDIQTYYEINHMLHMDLHYSIQDIESWFPYERELYVLMYKNREETNEAI